MSKKFRGAEEKENAMAKNSSDEDLDCTRWLIDGHSSPDEASQCRSGALREAPTGQKRLSPFQVRQKLSQGRRPRPDTSTGLACYFLDKCPPLSWAGGLEYANFRSIISVFSELKQAGVTPDTCRAMIDIYFTRLGNRTPSRAYCWDFKFKRYELLKALDESGATNTVETFENWEEQPTVTEDRRAAYNAAWRDAL